MPTTTGAVAEVLLRRGGLLFVEPGPATAPDEWVQAFEVELAALGYACSQALRLRLQTCSAEALRELHGWVVPLLAKELGADVRHQPLFRRFPDGVPPDTYELWWDRVLVHFLQAPGQPCVTCHEVGTTHVLSPCHHVVCDRCFDGANYSACPVCGNKVDAGSPFFEPSDERALPKERVRFKVLHLGEDIDAEARALVQRFCERTQAMSPDDREAFTALVTAYGKAILGFVPARIAVKENTAILLGTLLQRLPVDEVSDAAATHLQTATDVLRVIAGYSDADVSLAANTIVKQADVVVPSSGPLRLLGRLLGSTVPASQTQTMYVSLTSNRFKTRRMPRRLRRFFLSQLERLDEASLTEDMLRHRSAWIHVGEVLHPGEHEKRFPKTARAFAVLRRKAPDGTRAPRFQTFYSRLDEAAQRRDADAMLTVLEERPGELARAFDHLVRTAASDPSALRRAVLAFEKHTPRLSNPVLLTLRNHLRLRTSPSPKRIYWPKGEVSRGYIADDTRPTLPGDAVGPAVAAIDDELLRRVAAKPSFRTAILDRRLRDIIAPFQERGASPSAVDLPRGSVVDVPPGKAARLFLHWCEPPGAGHRTDLDLSVGLYGADWAYLGVCSYYSLKLQLGERVVARSSGDFTSAPYPDGASEFVDVDLDAARAAGARYAVMVVNAYAGMPFRLLERGFAGVMLRDDLEGAHFDPRTVKLRFSLRGESGVYLPLVLDLERRRLHWLDVYAKGGLAFNNVATSNRAIQRTCPALMDYFASGARTSMWEVAARHAAARCQRAFVRSDATVTLFERAGGESAAAFHTRLLSGEGGVGVSGVDDDGEPVLAALFEGDLPLPHGSEVYALFQGERAGNVAASDLLA